MKRNGQFYMIDAFFAATILFLGLGLLLNTYVSVPQQDEALLIAEDASTLLLSTPISEIDTDYILTHYSILDETKTPASQAHLWLWNATQGCTWCAENATALLESVLADVVPQQHGVSVVIDEEKAYNRPLPREAEFMIVEQTLEVTDVNETFSLGPDVVEVRIWG